jgi:hypothetical protein
LNNLDRRVYNLRRFSFCKSSSFFHSAGEFLVQQSRALQFTTHIRQFHFFKVISQNYNKITSIRRAVLMYFGNKLKIKRSKTQHMGCQFSRKPYCNPIFCPILFHKICISSAITIALLALFYAGSNFPAILDSFLLPGNSVHSTITGASALQIFAREDFYAVSRMERIWAYRK